MKQIRSSIVLGLLLGCSGVLVAQPDSSRVRVGADSVASPASEVAYASAKATTPLGNQFMPATASREKLLLTAASSVSLQQDTIPRRRASISYSDGYGTRATIHKTLAWAMLPLFAASYISGDKLFEQGSTASNVTKYVHRGAATGVSVLFAANTVTGGINLWQSRNDPAMRKRRFLHAALFTAATAGFTYAGVVLADQAETSLSKRQAHRTVNLFSMGLSTASALVMLVGPNR